jgi:hypothetical protein
VALAGGIVGFEHIERDDAAAVAGNHRLGIVYRAQKIKGQAALRVLPGAAHQAVDRQLERQQLREQAALGQLDALPPNAVVGQVLVGDRAV